MGRPSPRGATDQSQNDPGESNNPRSSAGDFDAHIWTSLNQIFERLGKIDQKVDSLSAEQDKLKTSVEKHDKVIVRSVFTVGGAVAIIVALWFVYDNILKDHVAFK